MDPLYFKGNGEEPISYKKKGIMVFLHLHLNLNYHNALTISKEIELILVRAGKMGLRVDPFMTHDNP
jgi:hypothetical protein